MHKHRHIYATLMILAILKTTHTRSHRNKHTMYLALLAGSRSLTAISPFSSQDYSSSSPSLYSSLHSASSFLPSGFSLQKQRQKGFLEGLYKFCPGFTGKAKPHFLIFIFPQSLAEKVGLTTVL